MVDNLRRALLAPSLVLAAVLALAVFPAALPTVVASVLVVALCPAFVRLIANLVRPPERDRWAVRWPLVGTGFDTQCSQRVDMRRIDPQRPQHQVAVARPFLGVQAPIPGLLLGGAFDGQRSLAAGPVVAAEG
jgi:hypothetical protein